MGFLELRQAPKVYSRVTKRMHILNGSLFSEVRTPVRCPGHLGKLNKAWQHSTDPSGSEAKGQVSLNSFHSYIGIPINFHE